MLKIAECVPSEPGGREYGYGQARVSGGMILMMTVVIRDERSIGGFHNGRLQLFTYRPSQITPATIEFAILNSVL
jgi:hypothetical protein